MVIEKLLPIPRLNEAEAANEAATGRPASKQALDAISAKVADPSASPAVDYLFEPNPAELLNLLLPMHVAVQVQRALLESSAAEHAARMQSMDARRAMRKRWWSG